MAKNPSQNTPPSTKPRRPFDVVKRKGDNLYIVWAWLPDPRYEQTEETYSAQPNPELEARTQCIQQRIYVAIGVADTFQKAMNIGRTHFGLPNWTPKRRKTK